MSSQDDTPEDELEPVSFQPLPNIITAFSADASPFEALSESVDNSIDHVRSRAYDGHEPEDDLEVTITFVASDSTAESEIIVEDNAGGVEADNLSRFFQWGASDTAPESIGRFGVGASRIAALGGKIQYQSRAIDQKTGYGFQVNVSEMETHDGEVTDETYQASRQIVDNLDEGCTRIVISDLKRSLVEILGIEPDSSSDQDSYDELDEVDKEQLETAVKELAGQFGDYFERYITDGIRFEADYFPVKTPSIDVSIDVELEFDADENEGEEDGVDEDNTSISVSARPPAPINYSYLPFDSLGPRRYEGLPFAEDSNADSPFRVDIEVGLMLNSDDDKAGLTLYANDRKILSRDTANPLFSSDYLGRYRSESGHSRLVIEVEMQGEIAEMPVNSLKSDLDMNSPVSDPLLRIVKNAAKRYRKQTYSSMPGWILSVYHQDHPFATNGGKIQEFDKSGAKINSARFRKQPGNSRGRRTFGDRDRLRSIVKVHSALRIYDTSPLRPKEEPAYNQYFEQKYEDDIADREFAPVEVANLTGPELDWNQISITADEDKLSVIQAIKTIAKQHYNAGGRADETNELLVWQVPRYREELRQLTQTGDLNETDLEVWDTIPKKILAESLRDLARALEHAPSKEDMDEQGPYKARLYVELFGSWDDALLAADLREPPEEDKEPEDDLESDTDDSSSDPTKPWQTDTDDSDGDSSDDIGFEGFGGAHDETTDSAATDAKDSARTKSIQGTGIVIDGEYYRIPDEDKDVIEAVLELSDETEPQEAWNSLKEVLEWYKQMPGK